MPKKLKVKYFDMGKISPGFKEKKLKESDIQAQCVSWFRLQYPDELIFSIPNGAMLGGKNRFAMYNMLKKTGLTKGIPDLFIAEIKTRRKDNVITEDFLYHDFFVIAAGLFIETKTSKGSLTQDQRDIHAILRKKRYQVEVCRSLDDFIEVVKEYMGEI